MLNELGPSGGRQESMKSPDEANRSSESFVLLTVGMIIRPEQHSGFRRDCFSLRDWNLPSFLSA